MIPDALISCGYLLLGSGWCIYRLAKHSNDSVSRVLPQFVIASIGIGAIGARSMQALIYNLFWRDYPIDPISIIKELEAVKREKNVINWILRQGGIASLVYSLYHHYKLFVTGAMIVVTLGAYEVFSLMEDIASKKRTETSRIRENGKGITEFVKEMPFRPAVFWILSIEMLGRAYDNNLFRLANVLYASSIWAFPLEGFYRGWSISDTIDDYTMLCYVIVIAEGLCRDSIVQ